MPEMVKTLAEKIELKNVWDLISRWSFGNDKYRRSEKRNNCLSASQRPRNALKESDALSRRLITTFKFLLNVNEKCGFNGVVHDARCC